MKNLESILNAMKRMIGMSLLAGAFALAGNAGEPQQEPKKAVENGCYGPFRKNENPDKGVYPTTRELKEDVSFISKFFGGIRIYEITHLEQVPELCDEHGIDCYAGAWISKHKIENEKEIKKLIKIANSKYKSVKGVVVGNEVLLRKDLPKKELSDYIKKVNAATEIPVGTAETWKELLENKDIAENCDFILVHIHPYWEGVSIEKAVEHVFEKYELVKKAFPEKNVIIGETGWPSKGDKIGKAVPSLENQVRFFESFTKQAKEKKIPYFYFEVFNEEWKIKFEGDAGAYWGIFNSDGSLEPVFKGLFPKEAMTGIKRQARIVEKVKVNAPITVYSDGESDDNHFQPTGWMGDLEDITIERDCKDNPHSGKSCTKLIYKSNHPQGWAGIYWQSPINNWGEYPGYEIKGVSKLVFWARGEKGGEKAEFKVGGINRDPYNNPKLLHQDSFGPISAEKVTTLTKEWKKYEIDLKGEDTSKVIGGFCWVTNKLQNEGGCIIYLDDVIFE